MAAASNRRSERNGRRKSDPGTLALRANGALDRLTVFAGELPWGGAKIVPATTLDVQMNSGVFASQSLLIELFSLFERKLTAVTEDEPLEKLVNKSLQRGEDPFFDNLCRTLSGISELCLPAVLKSLISWIERMEKLVNDKINPASENRFRLGKRLLAAHYLFCLVLIEVLPQQLERHLTECEPYVNYIMRLAFKQVAYRDPSTLGVNHTNSLVVAETYAEVVGVLSSTHFQAIHHAFFAMLNEYKKETSPANGQNIIALLMAMKFVKIKTNQVREFEMGIRFLDELGTYFLEAKDREVKHAVAGLLVEILLPVAAQIKRETNIPALISFVQKLYGPTNDLVNKKQHKLAAYPLLTCLLCVSQRQFFLSNWASFLNACLASLRNKDSRISRVALESLYRLLWVYIIRNNCDGNSSTRTRLESICASLFPKGNRNITPREAPLNIFVKIIHFIAQQKLDFAFKEVIFDLLGCSRSNRSLCPERMNIGIRALMVIADGLQQKDEPPAMPKSIGPLASGTMLRMKKKTYITRPLTVDIARTIGLDQYYIPCRKAFDNILRILDAQVGKPLMLTAIQGRGKEPEELLTGDVKPKLDLFRTCVAAMPRLLPDPMTHVELIEILTRITVHIDDELRTMAGQTLQNMISEFPEWRETIVSATLSLLINQLTDTYPVVLDLSLRTLLQLVTTWRIAATNEKRRDEEDEQSQESPMISSPSHLGMQTKSLSTASAQSTSGISTFHSTSPSTASTPTTTASHSATASTGSSPKVPNLPLYVVNNATALHAIEGFALVMLCQIRQTPRKISISLLKEVKTIFSIISIEHHDTPMLTVLDEATPMVIAKYIQHVPFYERQQWNVDFAGACDKICCLESNSSLVNNEKGNEYMQWDPWACALSGYAEHRFLLSQCPTAVSSAWPALFIRLNAVNSYVDPNNPQNESRASLLRSSKSKGSSSICGEQLSQDGCLSLWQKYVVLCMALCPPPPSHHTLVSRSFSPTSSVDTDVLRGVPSAFRTRYAPTSNSPSTQQLFQKALAMLRWENMTDIRDSVVLGIGSLNPAAIDAWIDELGARGVLREAQEKKIESNVRRRKRKDLLRLQILRMLELVIFRGYLEMSGFTENGITLNQSIIDFVDSMRVNLEVDQDRDRDINTVTSMRLHFAKLITLIIDSVPHEARLQLIPEERKQSLFTLFKEWSSRTYSSERRVRETEFGTHVEQNSVIAMCRILCCGPIFEPQKSLGNKGYLYTWLEKFVSSPNHTMQEEIEEMLAWMVQLNESVELLDWIVNQCYAQPHSISSRCVKSLVRAFSHRELPCEFVSLFVLCQAAAADRQVADSVLNVLEMLKRQFLDSPSSMASPLLVTTSPSASNVPLRRSGGNTLVLHPSTPIHPLPVEQSTVCRHLAKSYPQLTLTVFSEVCARIESARAEHQASLLSALLPWIENLELVDPVAGEDSCEGPRGYGSEEATQLLLNNLIYLTANYLDQGKEICELWRALSMAFPANMPIILHFLYTTINLSPDRLLSHAKRVVVMIAGVSGTRLAALLLDQLIAHDSTKTVLERAEMPPFYRWRDDLDTIRRKESMEEKQYDGPKRIEIIEKEEDTATEGVRELPMPAYGGHYSPLLAFLPPVTQQIQYYSKSQVALLLLCDVIRSSCDVDWAEATPRLLHASILHLDSMRPLLCSHARQTIINVCLLKANSSQVAEISQILLENKISSDTLGLDLSLTQIHIANCSQQDPYCASTKIRRGEAWKNGRDSPTFKRLTHQEHRQMLLHSNAVFSSRSDLILAIVFCLSENIDTPLWANEDASPRCWRVSSAAQLTCLVRHIASLMLPSMPLLPVVWTQIAMRMALSLPHRHLAGRCFQIVSALCQPPGAWIPSLLSRLVETAGDANDDTQAYVTDLILCLHSNVQHLSPPIDPGLAASAGSSSVSPTHTRSTSYTPALLRQSGIRQNLHERKDARLSLLVAEEEPWVWTSMVRSKSAEQLKTDGEEEEANTRVQVLAIAVSLLESGIDNEFLLALHLLEKALNTSEAQKQKCLEKLEKTVKQLDWKGFSGIVGLVTRGLVIPGAHEQTIEVLLNLVELVEYGVVGGRSSLSLIICGVLPHLLCYFDQPNQLCLQAAEIIRKFCEAVVIRTEEQASGDSPLDHLSMMFSAYAQRSFAKDRFQWAKCVIQYMCDGLHPNATHLVVLLAEMLDRGLPTHHVYALHMLYLLVTQRECSPSPVSINAQVIRAVSRHVGGSNWREAARVFKSIVEQAQKLDADKDTASITSFSLDPESIVQTSHSGDSPSTPRKITESSIPKRQPPQIRVRERLVGLLSASGLRVGVPNAPSVLFSHSELGSAASSTEHICSSRDVDSTTSLPPDPSISDSYPRVFKEFDFLEAEHDSVSETAESCFGWLSTMRPTSIADRERSASSNASDDADDDGDEESEESADISRKSLVTENEILRGIAREIGSPAHSRHSTEDGTASDERTPCPSEVDDEETKEDAVSDKDTDETDLEKWTRSQAEREAVWKTQVEHSEMDSEFSEMDVRTTEDGRSITERSLLDGRVGESLSIAGSSFCCRSASSMDTPTARLPSLVVLCPHHTGSLQQAEATWMRTIAELSADDLDGETTAQSVLVATQLFRSCCWRACSLLRDAMVGFSTSRSLSRPLLSAHDVLTKVADCPFLYVTDTFLLRANCLQRLKFSLTEMREHLETFNERREQAMRALASLKSAQKLSNLNLVSSSPLPTSQSAHPQRNMEQEICKLLHKLFFQLMLINDSISDMARAIREIPSAQDFSLSPAVMCLQRELLQFAADLPPESNWAPRESFADSLLLLIANKQYAQALGAVRQLRSSSISQEWGCCEVVDVDILLLLFCRSHTMRAWAIVGGDESTFGVQSQLLREANADLSSTVRRLAMDVLGSGTSLAPSSLTGSLSGPPLALQHASSTSRTPTVSSIADSFSKITLPNSDSPSSSRSNFYDS
ncbi:unnamed protein product, partial [Mesorhabditis belari]|uniref:Uncharacterized protein n=1 Tax=Mesorhabditis belari TaxID=2138241 RepID=A0AAF3EAY5_9BILA